MSSIPWYKDGLRFKCNGCGKCCTGQPGYVFVTDEEIKEMSLKLNISEKVFKIKYIRQRNNQMALVEKKTESGEYQCIFLKEKRCEVYEARPKQCRTFPWWKENLRSEESWQLAALNCEGIEINAPVVAFNEIENLLKE